MEPEHLGYVSSQPLFVDNFEAEKKAKDEANLSTLEQVLKLLHDRRKHYEHVSSLTTDEKDFTIKQQLAVNQKVLLHLQEIEGLVINTINKLKEIR